MEPLFTLFDKGAIWILQDVLPVYKTREHDMLLPTFTGQRTLAVNRARQKHVGFLKRFLCCSRVRADIMTKLEIF